MQIIKKIGKGKYSWEPERWITANEEGKSVIKIIHSNLKLPKEFGRTFILINNEPLGAMDQCCPTCSGIMYSGYADKSKIEKWLADIREDTQDITMLNESTIDHFFPLLELFEPGLYTMGIVEHETIDKKEGLFWNMYGKKVNPVGLPWGNSDFGPKYLFPTQSISVQKEEVIENYRRIIENGGAPFGIAYYFSGFISLLLDGHHKATAYNRLEKSMPCLTIQHLGPCKDSTDKVFYEPIKGERLNSSEIPPKILDIDDKKFDPILRDRLDAETSLDYSYKLGIKSPLEEFGLSPIEALNIDFEEGFELKKYGQGLFYYALQELDDEHVAKEFAKKILREKVPQNKYWLFKASKLFIKAGDYNNLKMIGDLLIDFYNNGEGTVRLDDAIKVYKESGLTVEEIRKRSVIMADYLEYKEQVDILEGKYKKGQMSKNEFRKKDTELLISFTNKHPKKSKMKKHR